MVGGLLIAAVIFALTRDTLPLIVAAVVGAFLWMRACNALPSRWWYAACAALFGAGVVVVVLMRHGAGAEAGLLLVSGAPTAALMLFLARSAHVSVQAEGTSDVERRHEYD